MNKIQEIEKEFDDMVDFFGSLSAFGILFLSFPIWIIPYLIYKSLK